MNSERLTLHPCSAGKRLEEVIFTVSQVSTTLAALCFQLNAGIFHFFCNFAGGIFDASCNICQKAEISSQFKKKLRHIAVLKHS